MRRSRQSLGWLLALMSLSLAVVRATTEPGGLRKAESNIDAPAARAAAACQSAPRSRETGAAHAKRPHRSSLGVSRSKSGINAPASTAAAAPRMVSMAAVIVLLPQRTENERMTARTGWSGCTAFAAGIDHLGRPLPAAAPRRVGHHLIARGLEKLVVLAQVVSSHAAIALCDAAAPIETPHWLAGDRQAK